MKIPYIKKSQIIYIISLINVSLQSSSDLPCPDLPCHPIYRLIGVKPSPNFKFMHAQSQMHHPLSNNRFTVSSDIPCTNPFPDWPDKSDVNGTILFITLLYFQVDETEPRGPGDPVDLPRGPRDPVDLQASHKIELVLRGPRDPVDFQASHKIELVLEWPATSKLKLNISTTLN